MWLVGIVGVLICFRVWFRVVMLLVIVLGINEVIVFMLIWWV